MMNKPPYFIEPAQDCPGLQSHAASPPQARPASSTDQARSAGGRELSGFAFGQTISVYARERVISPHSFEVSASASRRRVKRETGTARSCAQACAAPATVGERGSVTMPLQEKRLREGDRSDPTSPETGLARQVETLRGSGAPVAVLFSLCVSFVVSIVPLAGTPAAGGSHAIQKSDWHRRSGERLVSVSQ